MGDVTIGIHQPNYLPWLGYFAKIAQSDIFVILDSVQFEKGGYTNRCKIKVGEAEHWLTQSVQKKGILDIQLKDVKFADLEWIHKHIKTLQMNYSRTPFFESFASEIFSSMQLHDSSLSSFNSKLIQKICEVVGLKTKIVCASEVLEEPFENPNARIVALVKALNGSIYLSGSGAKAYNDEDLFHAEGISLAYYSFKPKDYHQGKGDFIPGLSVLDALFNVGPEKINEMIRSYDNISS